MDPLKGNMPVPAGKVHQVPRTCTAGLRKKLKQETTKMGSRGSDTSPRRDAVWHQLYSTSHIYTEKRERDKTVDLFFLVSLYILQTVTRNLESMGMAPCYYFLHQITFLCAWEVCTELQVPAVNKRLISGVAGQRAMFASKPSRTEAAPRAVSFGQMTQFSWAAPHRISSPPLALFIVMLSKACGALPVRTGSFVWRTQLWELPQSLRVCLQT